MQQIFVLLKLFVSFLIKPSIELTLSAFKKVVLRSSSLAAAFSYQDEEVERSERIGLSLGV